MALINSLSPDQIRQVVYQIQLKSQESRSTAQYLKNCIEGMHSKWQGMYEQRFYKAFIKWNIQFIDCAELLDSIQSDLAAIADKFETIDNELAGYIKHDKKTE